MSKEAMTLALEASKDLCTEFALAKVREILEEALANHIPDDTKMVSGVKDSLTTQQEQDVDWKDMYEKEKRRSAMWIAKYEKDIEPLEYAFPAKQEQGGWHTHDLYTDEDKDRPDVICDINGQVALGLCKRCGRGEAQLETPCDKPKHCEYCKRGLKTMCLCGLNPKQEPGEPVAWMHKETALLRKEINKPKGSDWDADHWIPLYTTPYVPEVRQQRKPLTRAEIINAVAVAFNFNSRDYDEIIEPVARAIEAAHGIKE